MIRVLGLLLLLCGAVQAATSPGEMLADPAEEARARALSQELRCLVCQNQSIDDSDADLAKDLRRIVREQIAAGHSDAEIKAFLVARYGEFVLLEPPVKPTTWLLWAGPFLVLVLGGGALAIVALRRRAAHELPAPELTEGERAELQKLLEPEARSG
jgi:cytochrome c-type biogenesis protein CcmH